MWPPWPRGSRLVSHLPYKLRQDNTICYYCQLPSKPGGLLMTCRRVLLLVLLAMATITGSARASWLLGADAGVAAPTGTLSDLWSSGFTGGVSASYLLSPRFAVGIDGSYNSFGTTSDYQALLDFIDPGASNDFTIWQLGAHGHWMVPVGQGGKFSPYVTAGLGLYSLKDEYESPTNSDKLSQTAFGLRAGLGCDYWVGPKLGLGIDANYNDTFTSEDEI